MPAVTLHIILFEHVSVLKILGARKRTRGWWRYIYVCPVLILNPRYLLLISVGGRASGYRGFILKI